MLSAKWVVEQMTRLGEWGGSVFKEAECSGLLKIILTEHLSSVIQKETVNLKPSASY